MKKTLLFLAVLLSAQMALGQFTERRVNWEECSYDRFSEYPKRTLYLWGRVYKEKDPKKADVKVRIIRDKTSFADLFIAIDKSEKKWYSKAVWHFVTDKRKADFSVCFVEKDENFSIRIISLKELNELRDPYSGLFDE